MEIATTIAAFAGLVLAIINLIWLIKKNKKYFVLLLTIQDKSIIL